MRGSVVTFVAGVVMAVLAVFLMNRFMSIETPARATVVRSDLGGVVVAKQALPVGTTLRADMLTVQQWPASSRPATSFAAVTDLVAEGAAPRVALRDIKPGEPILQVSVSGFGERATLSRQVANGMRAVSVRINDVSGVAGFTLPGDRVDVLLTREIGGQNVTDVILQNITVLGIDQLTDQQRDKPVIARTATVEVNPVAAQKLVLAQQEGTLSFSLRNAAYTENIQTSRISAGDLAGPVRALAPPPPPPPSVRVRRGSEAVTARNVPM